MHAKTAVIQNHGGHQTERVGFEPTCPKEDNRISSAARYDHFDTTPHIYGSQTLHMRCEPFSIIRSVRYLVNLFFWRFLITGRIFFVFPYSLTVRVAMRSARLRLCVRARIPMRRPRISSSTVFHICACVMASSIVLISSHMI